MNYGAHYVCIYRIFGNDIYVSGFYCQEELMEINNSPYRCVFLLHIRPVMHAPHDHFNVVLEDRFVQDLLEADATPGVAVAVGCGVCVGVNVLVAVGVLVGVEVLVAVGCGVAVLVGVFVGVGVLVAVGEGIGVWVGMLVAVAVGVAGGGQFSKGSSLVTVQ